jgi:ubiquinone/menaquinone biosynthesis C-methylase UbiE
LVSREIRHFPRPVRAIGVSATASIIDIGGGTSRLVDALLDKGFKTVTVLDLSEKALATSKARLGAKGAQVQWIVADITTWGELMMFGMIVRRYIS